jgi:hypothetical protein
VKGVYGYVDRICRGDDFSHLQAVFRDIFRAGAQASVNELLTKCLDILKTEDQ